jgi:ribonuclease HI
VCIVPPKGSSKLCSFKMDFECTNNVAEYEDLILGLNSLNDLKSRRIVMHGDYEIVINKVKGIFQKNHPRMRPYRNEVLELLEGFTEYDISLIPKGKNMTVDDLATLAIVFKIHIHPNKKYEI